MSDLEPVPPTHGGGAVDLVSATGAPVGLEDFDVAEEGVIPRLTISHGDCVFVDNLSGEEFSELDVVILGLVKQRVLWAPEVAEDGGGPLCKSLNFHDGLPNPETFPLKESGFDALDETLPCASCKLKDWGSHPSRDTPWCGEQHVLIVLMGDEHIPALLTVQRSALKNSRTYMSAFSRSRTPLFTVRTTIELDPRRRGSVSYAVPKFRKGEATPEDRWAEFATIYGQVRTFVTSRPSGDGEGEDVTTPVAAPTPTPSAPATPTDADGEDLPF